VTTTQQRLIALKTGFEALLGESNSSRVCARKLRSLFENSTASHCNLLPWAGILWSPKEKTDLVRYFYDRKNRRKEDVRSELEDWFMTLVEARNSIIHKGVLSVRDYGPPPERPLSRYVGKLFWIGERLLREAIKASLGSEVLLCARIRRWATFDRFLSQSVEPPQPATLGNKPEPDNATALPARSLQVLLQELGCQAANQVELRMSFAGRSASEEVARQIAAATRDMSEARSGARSISINSSERKILEQAGAEEQLPELFTVCD
jgi:hypothetical protein